MLPAALTLLLLASPPSMSDNTWPRVRPVDDGARTIIWSAEQSSPTVAELLAKLERSDVVVYVQTAIDLPARGVTNFVAYGEPLTYLLVRLELKQSPRDRVAMLAHELTHAVEITEATAPIRSEADLAALYRKVGVPGKRTGDFESSRALANERQARTEQEHTVRPSAAAVRH